MDDAITPLMPVLGSPLLAVHVSLVMLAYAGLAFTFFNALIALCVPRLSEMLSHVSRLMLFPSLFFLSLGIFLGAVWAGISWGTYWSWDPKETWALITLLVYALPAHGKMFPFLIAAKNKKTLFWAAVFYKKTQFFRTNFYRKTQFPCK